MGENQSLKIDFRNDLCIFPCMTFYLPVYMFTTCVPHACKGQKAAPSLRSGDSDVVSYGVGAGNKTLPFARAARASQLPRPLSRPLALF